MSTRKTDSFSVRSLERGLDILRVLNHHNGLTVTETAELVELPRPTSFRLLRTLERLGYIFRDDSDKKFRLTSQVRTLSHGFDEEEWLPNVARPLMIDLCKRILWPVAIITNIGTAMLVRDSTHSMSPFSMFRHRGGFKIPLLHTAAGQMYLACCTPDMREQLLRAGVYKLDAVAYTHSHSDHVNGLDDLRQIVFHIRRQVPVWADGPTQDSLVARFGYAFVQAEGSSYPPICELHTIRGPLRSAGEGGVIELRPFEVDHGDIDALGFRIGGLVYLPDVLSIPEPVWDEHLTGLDCWIVDALRRNPHPTHAHLALALEWLDRARPKLGVLTNMHNDLDYDTVEAETPPHIRAAFDGMVLEYEV